MHDPATEPASRGGLILNAFMQRSALLSQLLDGDKRDIDAECNYPKEISAEQYKRFYRRGGIGTRVVNIFPEESWAHDPELYDSEDSKETEFEKAVSKTNKELNLWHYLQRVDTLAGIGRYGILLLGFDDGKPLDQPLEGVLDTTELVAGGGKRKLIYLRAFDESVVQIQEFETEETSPRFGMPNKYGIQFVDLNQVQSSNPQSATPPPSTKQKSIHWTRVIHVADECQTSDALGTPRMESVYDRLVDIRKVMSGSGEMFWKGGFPGYSFEVNPDLVAGGAVVDKESLLKEIEAYSNGLQRYLALTGVSAKSLAPQVSDPNPHLEAHIKCIGISKGIPYRVFMGTEEAQLAGEADQDAWLRRINRRQHKFCTPKIILPLTARMVQTGVWPAPKNAEVTVDWPDLSSPSDKAKADVALIRTQALAAYVGGGVENLVPPEAYFVQVLDMTPDEAEALVKAGEKFLADNPPPETVTPEDAKAAAAQAKADGIKQGAQTVRNELDPVLKALADRIQSLEAVHNTPPPPPAPPAPVEVAVTVNNPEPRKSSGKTIKIERGAKGATATVTENFNDQHDESGRFAGGAGSGKTYSTVDSKQAKKLNIDKASAMLKERGIEMGSARSERIGTEFVVSYTLTDKHGKSVDMQVGKIKELLGSQRDRLSDDDGNPPKKK